MYSIFDIAEWFLQKEKVTHKKLQKLCYYAFAWNYTLRSSTLYNNTTFEAWVHGPVSPELYHKFKGNSWNKLEPENTQIDIDSDTVELLESVWVTYGDITGNALEALTHSELPWINARAGIPDNMNSDRNIDLNDIKKYYSSIYSGGEE